MQDGKVKLYVIGQGALGAAATAATKHDIAQAEQWNLPIVLIVLLAVFGSLAAAAMPLVLGICTVAVTMGLVYLLSMYTTMSVFVTSTVSMFGIALAIDYSLFILMRFREELRAGRDPEQAADAAMATSGLAVVLSGLTVIASVTGIYLINTPVLVSMATGAILAVAVAVLTSTTLTPAVLATFGRAAAKRSWLLHWSRRPETTQSRFWTRWTGWVMRRPWLSALGATVLLLTLAAPAFSMVLGNSMQRQFDPTHEIRGGVNAAADALGPGALGPVRVLVTFPDGNAASAPAKEPLLQAVQQRMSQAPNVVTVQPAVFGNDYRSALVSAVLSVDPEDMAARESVDWMRAQLPPVAGANAKIDVGGPTALIKDFDDRVSKTQPAVFGFVALIAFVMLLVSIRSVFLAFKGVLMTVLSVAAAYGSLVVVFQWGWLEDLGFRPISSLDSTIPPLVLAMTFGLVDGLRDLPADPHPRAVPADQQHPRRRRLRREHQRTHHHQRRADHDRGVHRLRVRGHAAGRAARRRVRGGDRRRRHRGAAGAGARADGHVRTNGTGGCRGGWPASCRRWTSRSRCRRPTSATWSSSPTTSRRWRRPESTSAWWSSRRPSSRTMAPQTITVADPLAFSGCLPSNGSAECVNGASTAHTNGHTQRSHGVSRNGKTVKLRRGPRPVHPVTMWRGRLSVALDALETEADTERPPVERNSPMETTNVQLPTGDRLQIPDRGGDVAAEELPDHVPEQHQRLRRVCRFGRLDGDSNRRSGTGRNGSVLLW